MQYGQSVNKRVFYEFFAGGGMARAGLGTAWRCAFANDFDPMKADVYRANWGVEDFVLADVNALETGQLPDQADLVWASFPCQDLSLAGNAIGLGTATDQTRSGAFWAFWRLMEALIAECRQPAVIVLENVYGALTANDGRDFAAICRSLALGGYRFSAVVIDAVHFVPQSRPRVFIVAIRRDLEVPAQLLVDGPTSEWHPKVMENAIDRLSEMDRQQWFWIAPRLSKTNHKPFSSIIEAEPTGVVWHTDSETEKLIAMMSDVNRTRLLAMQKTGRLSVGTIYKRTRVDTKGCRRQRAELRNDEIAGCLRTPGGGSSRQIVIVVDGPRIRTRLLSPREAARLMGLPDTYQLPSRYNDAYHVAGDGVVVPVVRFLAEAVIEPILDLAGQQQFLAAAE